ncbi:hypothetical protein HK414_03820 [Ramlibacter terrae]|uniref:HPt domain-containing protein n=1 Tax=Ramlibacter terrae TaxID=2732511 RepID=A0ABX6P6K8_9BURK|nr:hypothetical protein HK414_03820 [Ramlibacter terrae]
MLNYQPSLAKKLFVWDDLQGELRPLMGRAVEAVAEPEEPVQELSQELHDVVTEAGESGMGELGPRLDTLAKHAVLAQNTAVATAAREASAAVSAQDDAAAAVALSNLTAISQPAPVAPAPAATAEEDFEEDDLLDIFPEEAREVVGTGLAALQALAAEPGNLAEMTTLRRAFHTLKGSSRMVGLNEFGEAGWSMEQVMNTWLADQKASTEELRALCTQALRAFGLWVEDIAKHTDGEWKAGMFRGPADAMRTENRLLEIATPGAATVVEPVQAVELIEAIEVPSLEEVAPVAEAPQAAPQEAAPVVSDFDFNFDLAPPELPPEAPAPAAETVSVSVAAPMPELPAFTMDFTPMEPAAEPEPERAAAAESVELSADELPPEFAELAATMIMPKAAAPESLPEPDPFVENDAFNTTVIQPRMEFTAPPRPSPSGPRRSRSRCSTSPAWPRRPPSPSRNPSTCRSPKSRCSKRRCSKPLCSKPGLKPSPSPRLKWCRSRWPKRHPNPWPMPGCRATSRSR